MTVYAVKVSAYKTSAVREGFALRGQPRLHPYFHRPFEELLQVGFRAGFVLDGFEEPAFPPDHRRGRVPPTWGGDFCEIPPVVVARMRPREKRTIGSS